MLDYEDRHVSFATSSDEHYSPDMVIDGNQHTFWATTGLFPQVVVISFNSPRKINSVRMRCYNVKRFRIEGCEDTEQADFKVMGPIQDLDEPDGQLKDVETSVTEGVGDALHLRITIDEGYDHFCCVQSVDIS